MDNEQLRVLLVDDDKDDYSITRKLFSKMGRPNFELDWVATYEAGLEEILRNRHDVYLIDYRLGTHDGLELLREAIRQGCKAPIIILTGQGDHEIDVEATEAGAADYLVKGPLGVDLLERSIRYSIERV